MSPDRSFIDQLQAGGPYRVWVRWNKPTESIEEYRESLKRIIASVKDQMKSGDLPPSPGRIERLEQMIRSDRIMLSECGVTGVEPNDIEPASIDPPKQRPK